MDIIHPLTYRKNIDITSAIIPNGTKSIGDASYSLCPNLAYAEIPVSVERIGAASFCGSGLESVKFLGKPSEIDASAFDGCTKLKRIIVRKGYKEIFEQLLNVPATIIEEDVSNPREITGSVKCLDKKECHLNYNNQYFRWHVGDEVFVSEVFSSPVNINHKPSFQFRKRCLFAFFSSDTLSPTSCLRKYKIPVPSFFARRYHDKYGSRKVRVFLFHCDNNGKAYFWDEVILQGSDSASILVSSVL